MTKRYFHWDAVDDCVMHETDGAGATTVEYTHEPGPFGPLLSETRSGVESYHHYDALGSTTALSDPTGALTDTFQYDAWGNQVARTGTTPTTYTWVGRWGYQYDTPTGGYYIRARSYQPTVARWMSADPLHAENASLSQYQFCNAAPVNTTDPSGLLTIERAKVASHLGRRKCSEVVDVKWIFKLDTTYERNGRNLIGAPCDGYIVQHVVFSCDITGCNADAIDQETTGEYYEAWPIKRHHRQPSAGNARYTDRAAFDAPANSRGTHTADGVVRFYCDSQVTTAAERLSDKADIV